MGRRGFPIHGDFSLGFEGQFQATKMKTELHFYQDCPTCGRPTKIKVQYLGRWVSCRHCEGEFVAVDDSLCSTADAPGRSLLDRAERLMHILPAVAST